MILQIVWLNACLFVECDMPDCILNIEFKYSLLGLEIEKHAFVD